MEKIHSLYSSYMSKSRVKMQKCQYDFYKSIWGKYANHILLFLIFTTTWLTFMLCKLQENFSVESKVHGPRVSSSSLGLSFMTPEVEPNCFLLLLASWRFNFIQISRSFWIKNNFSLSFIFQAKYIFFVLGIKYKLKLFPQKIIKFNFHVSLCSQFLYG